MKIVQLQAENVKRLEAVSIKPDGNMVVIGGENGAGKSSVIDSIMYALGGGNTLPDAPIRKGEKSAQVRVELDDLTVTRKFTESGRPKVTVESSDGARYTSPQKMLDKLVGQLSFDPLNFARMEAKQQAESLRQLVGLDFSELDERRQSLYDERRDVNREAKSLKSRLDSTPYHDDAPEDEQSVGALSQQLEEAQQHNQAIRQRQQEFERQRKRVSEYADSIQQADDEIADLEARLKKAKEKRQSLSDERDELAGWLEREEQAIAGLEAEDEQSIRDKIQQIDELNRKARENQQHAELSAEHAKKEKESERLTNEIEQIDQDKQRQLAEADMPVDGLAFDDSGVTLNDVPFGQCSSAEQMRVSVAMGIAANPQLKVLLVRDGSLLDEKNLQLLADIAEQYDAQVWLERVGDGDEVSVVIEDGHVREEQAELQSQ